MEMYSCVSFLVSQKSSHPIMFPSLEQITVPFFFQDYELSDRLFLVEAITLFSIEPSNKVDT